MPLQCRLCFRKGHDASSCPFRNKCFRCGADNHQSSHCDAHYVESLPSSDDHETHTDGAHVSSVSTSQELLSGSRGSSVSPTNTIRQPEATASDPSVDTPSAECYSVAIQPPSEVGVEVSEPFGVAQGVGCDPPREVPSDGVLPPCEVVDGVMPDSVVPPCEVVDGVMPDSGVPPCEVFSVVVPPSETSLVPQGEVIANDSSTFIMDCDEPSPLFLPSPTDASARSVSSDIPGEAHKTSQLSHTVNVSDACMSDILQDMAFSNFEDGHNIQPPAILRSIDIDSTDSSDCESNSSKLVIEESEPDDEDDLSPPTKKIALQYSSN